MKSPQHSLHGLSSSIQEIRQAYRQRTLSPIDVTKAYLARIASWDPALHAYVEVYEHAALEQARASEHRLISGMPVGLLEGIPLGIKDLLHIEGRVTTAGSALLRTRKPAQLTSTVVQRLINAGAVILGKTHLVEFAYGGWGTNRSMGTPVNPWDIHVPRSPGGSSSGSGVAVAAGLAAGAIGTDTGGSVRIPSAYCGLTGLKTTQGRVSNHGVDYVSFTLDTIGPMTRSAEDAALMLQAIHGPDAFDTQTLHTPPEDFVASLHRAPEGTRISMIDPTLWGQVDNEVMTAVQEAVHVLRKAGCVQRDIHLPVDFTADQEETGIIISSEAYENWSGILEGKWAEGDTYSRSRIAAAGNISAARYAAALRNREMRKREFSAVFQHTDILVLPTVPNPATPITEVDESDLSPSRLTRFVGYYGLCAINLPCGFSRSGLPIGVQLVAAPFQEGALLRLAVAFQKLTEFHRRHPELRSSPA